MRIQTKADIDNVLSSLTSFNRIIEMSCCDYEKALSYLKDVNIVLPSKPHYKNQILRITPYEIRTEIEFSSIPPSFGELIPDTALNETIKVPDFEDSEQFYKKISNKNSPLKIITDQFSIRRGAELFKIVGSDELYLRRLVYGRTLSPSGDSQLPSNRNSKSPDNMVAQYGLFELLEKHLLRHSSAGFYLDQLNIAEDDREKLAARDSTMIDEIGLPISKNDFIRYIKTRNAIMHFKAITHTDVEFMVKSHEKLIHYNFDMVTREMYFDSIINENP